MDFDVLAVEVNFVVYVVLSAACSARRASIFHFCNLSIMKNWERFGIAVMSLWGLFAIHQGVNAMFREHHWTGMSTGDWGTWIGSIGTVGALFGTIYISQSERRRRIREEFLLANLHGAGLVPRLANTQSILIAVRASINTERPDSWPMSFEAHFNRVNQIEVWEMSELVPLASAFAPTALKLAECAYQVAAIKRHFDSVRQVVSGGMILSVVRETRNQSAITLGYLNNAIFLLGEAIEVLRHCRDSLVRNSRG